MRAGEIRFIPACAGNRWPARAVADPAAVHPRVRGEQGPVHSSAPIKVGSSPRARGTGSSMRALSNLARFIPACAGNRLASRVRRGARTVHPRVRGEQVVRLLLTPLPRGSSPRARGTGAAVQPEAARGRFIPACAGNRSSSASMSRASAVHPRVRGEQGEGPRIGLRIRGSSPRARGTECMCRPQERGRRFIPACAGNRNRVCAGACALPVHPRVRGEQGGFTAYRRHEGGSSPRARGTALAAQCARAKRRFIPACAGNSSRSAWRVPCQPVHPRVRGEQDERAGLRCGKVGSSPRARGTDSPRRQQTPRRRFIPACAGNRHNK